MTEVEKLKDRLKKKFENGLMNIHLTPGPEWNNLTEEERALIVNDILDASDRWDSLSDEEKMRIQIKEVYDDLKKAIKYCQFDIRRLMDEEDGYSKEELENRLHKTFGYLDNSLMTLGNWVRNR